MSYELKHTFASLPNTVRGYPTSINGDPKGKNMLYCNGNYVYIREIESPANCDVYSEHQYAAGCAKYSPSGYYIASGDATGKIRIWDTTQAEHILKSEFQPISGAIKDIAWDPESKRIMVGGDGREKYGHVFSFDTGTSLGAIDSHVKAINSVDLKPNRPYRAISGSEDFSSNFYEGPPFKFKQSNKEHTRFVQTVRYAPSGEFFATGSADGKVIIYNGKDSTFVHELGEEGKPAHTGGIYAVSWSPDSTQLLSAAGDKTAKIWDVNANVCNTEFKLGDQIADQQVGCLWQGDNLITVSLSGAINYLDKNNPETPKQVIWGHNKLIAAMTVSEDGSTVYTASSDGRVVQWDAATGKTDLIGGRPHSNQVNAMATVGDKVASIGMDDKLKFISVADKAYNDQEISTGSQPKSITSSHGGLIVVGCVDQVLVYRSETKASSLSVENEALSVAIHPNHQEIAVGSKDHAVYIYALDSSDTLTQKKKIEGFRNQVNSVAYSPDGKWLASGDSNKVVTLMNVESDYEKLPNQWQAHTASINEISWSPDSQHVASCSLDTGIVIWSVEKPMKKIQMKRAHPRSNIRNVRWLDNNSIVSSADDCCARTWQITHH